MIPLCNRCEHRVVFLESGHGPRCECQQETSVSSCYMYRPVLPVVLEPVGGDTREVGAAWVVAARAHGVEVPRMELTYRDTDKGRLLYWTPCENAEK